MARITNFIEIFFLFAILSLIIYFDSLKEVFHKKKENFDNKPVKTILYIGNSHTFTNDIPLLVNTFLESLDTTNFYLYTSITQGGVGLKYHTENLKVQEALKQKHDFTIIQPQSSEVIYNLENNAFEFHKYGEILINKAKQTSIKTGLYQVWIPQVQIDSNNFTDSQKRISTVREYLYRQQILHYTKLAKNTNVDIIPVGQSWYKATKECPHIALLGSDNHHASLQGSYLIALTIARYINNNKILSNKLSFPDTISGTDAKCLINSVNIQ